MAGTPRLLAASGIEPERSSRSIDDARRARAVRAVGGALAGAGAGALVSRRGATARARTWARTAGARARVALNVGTSAALRVVLPEPLGARPPWALALPGGRRGARWWAGRHRRAATCSPGAGERLALPGETAAVEAALARSASPTAHGLTALPFLAGERSPGWRATRGRPSPALSRHDASRSRARLLEAVALRLALVYERLAPLAAPDHVVVASGGALRHSPAWTRMLTDALGVPVALGGDPEASARGAALLALEALGVALPEAPEPVRV